MSEHEDVLGRAAAWSDGGLGVALATVVSTWGSAPRPAGSHLAVNERGEFVGSVSGGCVEAAVVREALDAIRNGKARLLEYGVSHDRAWELGLACGGTIQVFVEPMRRAIVDRLRRSLSGKQAVVLATELATGEARLVDQFGENPGLDPALARAARAAAERDASTRRETLAGSVFLRVYNPAVSVVIVGAVHIAQALAPMVRLAGFDALVVDPRRAFGTEDRFAGVPLLVEWPDEALARIGLGRRTAVVAMTHDPKIDDPALAAALRSDAFYVGCLGSRKTQAARRDRLRAMGFGETALARIHGPVGLPIGAASPGEIAVSILSEIVASLRRSAEVLAGA
jgi:xanthine dehydrogenase accessory factor